MKKLISACAIALLLLLAAENNFAQSEEQPLLVVSFNMVAMSDMGKISSVADSLFVPILKEFVDEGKIYSFGRFNHFWGDEWNFNMWYTVKDMSTFDAFWEEYVNRVNERHPGAFGSVVKYFQAHKDNIYTIEHQYPAPPQK
jgi:hypothetical protein